MLPFKVVVGTVAGVLVAGSAALYSTYQNKNKENANQVGESLQVQRDTLFKYFKHFSMLPILIPEGQSIGDVYDMDTWALKDEAEQCFPDMDVGEAIPTALPDVLGVSEATAKSLFDIPTLVTGSASVEYDNNVSIRYVDTTVQNVSLSTLRESLSKECSYLRPIMNGKLTDPNELSEIPLIVGRLVYGRPEIFIGLKDEIGAELDAAAKFTTEKADNSIQASFNRQGDKGVVLKSTEVFPIAFLPAFLPKPIFDEIRGNEQSKVTLVGYEWSDTEAEFDPEDYKTIILGAD